MLSIFAELMDWIQKQTTTLQCSLDTFLKWTVNQFKETWVILVVILKCHKRSIYQSISFIHGRQPLYLSLNELAPVKHMYNLKRKCNQRFFNLCSTFKSWVRGDWWKRVYSTYDQGRNEGQGGHNAWGAESLWGRRINGGLRKVPTMSRILFSIQHICFRKTLGSNMRAPSLFLPQTLSNLGTPLHMTCFNAFSKWNICSFLFQQKYLQEIASPGSMLICPVVHIRDTIWWF